MSEKLKDEIQQGLYRIGCKLPSEHNLAKQFGVSRVTVRQALDVLQEEGYINRKQGLGTFVNHLENGKPPVKIHHVALILADSEILPDKNDYYRVELTAAERWLAERDITIFLATLDSGSIAHGVIPPILKQNMIQGVLLDGRVHDIHRHVLEERGLPYIIMGNHPISKDLPQIKIAFERIAANAVEFLYDHNPQPVMLLLAPFPLHFIKEIYNGYCKAVERLPQRRPLLELCQNDDGYVGMKRLLRQGCKKFSVLTTDQVHHGVLQVYREEGISTQDNPIVVIGDPSRIYAAQRSLVHVIPIRAQSVTLSAVQILTKLIEGKQKNVYEELYFDIEPPEDSTVLKTGKVAGKKGANSKKEWKMIRKTALIMIAFVLLCGCASQAADKSTAGKKVIIFGGSVSQDFYDYFTENQNNTAVSGVTVDFPLNGRSVRDHLPDMSYGKYSEQDIQARIEQWRRVSDKFPDSLLRINVGGIARAEWFDDNAWNIIIERAKQLSRLVKKSGMAGYCLDTEQYGSWRSFTYSVRNTVKPLVSKGTRHRCESGADSL